MNYKQINDLVSQINDCNFVLNEKPQFGMAKVPSSLHSFVDNGILKLIEAKRSSLLDELEKLTNTHIEI